MPKKRNPWPYHLAFVAVMAAILAFLWNAPPETTARVPFDKTHQRFYTMKRREAERFCEKCHNPKGEVPLPKGHPPKFRCLFCHKMEKR